MTRLLKVNLVSESFLGPRGHGVHSVFVDEAQALGSASGISVTTNSWSRTDIQHVHTLGPYSFLLRGRSTRRVATAHLTPDSLKGSICGAELLHKLVKATLVGSYNEADLVIALTHWDHDLLRDLGVRTRIEVIPNAVGSARFDEAAETSSELSGRIASGPPIVLGVGQLQKRKAIDTFIDCARAIPEARFVWAGGAVFGPLSSGTIQIRQSIAAAPSNCHFLGSVSRKRVASEMDAATLFFLPSRHENCSVSVLESLAAGLPVVIRDLPQHRELFGDSCLYGDDSIFVDQIRLLLTSGELLGEYSRRARKAALNFSMSTKTARIVSLYKELLEQ